MNKPTVSMTVAPMKFQWDGEVMTPIFPKLANRNFVIGEIYRLEEVQERSYQSHKHYFAMLHQIWLNLPEHEAERFPTSEHMRKFALIKCGYVDERSMVCSSNEQAHLFATFIKPLDQYAIITVADHCVRIFTARSQSMKAMRKTEFQVSKTAVLDYCASLCNMTQDEFAANIGKVV